MSLENEHGQIFDTQRSHIRGVKGSTVSWKVPLGEPRGYTKVGGNHTNCRVYKENQKALTQEDVNDTLPSRKIP